MFARLACVWSATLVASCVVLNASAQEFRVETEVFTDENKEPVSESLTIFTGTHIYDFLLKEPEEITIFDIQHGRIVLLDPTNKLRTDLTTAGLLEICDGMKTVAADKGESALFTPQFQQTFDQERSLLTLSSEHLTYKAKGVPAKHAEGAKQFQQFADWYARLNAIRPGNLPPFGRIQLNKGLAERNLVPEDIERTVIATRSVPDKKLVARGHHVFTWLISNTDRHRIERAGEYMTKFPQVELEEYWKVNRVALGKK